MISENLARALFRMAVPSWIKEGLSMNAMLRQASELDFGVRRQWGQGEIRRLSGLIKNAYQLSHANPAAPVRSTLITETELGRDRRYRVYGNATFYNPLTGSENTRLVSFYTDNFGTPLELGDMFSDDFDRDNYEEGVTVTDFSLQGVEHNEGMKY